MSNATTMRIGSYVKRWYDALEEGKVYASRCPKCGTVEMPPLPICNECGAYGAEWFEISGKGKLIGYDDCQAPMYGPEWGPVLSGLVELEEGCIFQAYILGVEPGEREGLFERLPIPVTCEIQQRDGYKYPAFRVVSE